MTDAEQATPEGARARRRVLIVEDDSFISTFLEDKLAESFEVVSVETTAEAREALGAGVDLMVLDILLPDENGLVLLEEMKQKGSAYQDVPVLVLSNVEHPEHIELAKKLGAVDYLVKGNQLPSDIAERIQQILAG